MAKTKYALICFFVMLLKMINGTTETNEVLLALQMFEASLFAIAGLFLLSERRTKEVSAERSK
ncbi:MAG: hypothetical protein HRU25_15435 [Psychrobium sp.]|nr:hypothetical protein [Psychrobium sp.]